MALRGGLWSYDLWGGDDVSVFSLSGVPTGLIFKQYGQPSGLITNSRPVGTIYRVREPEGILADVESLVSGLWGYDLWGADDISIYKVTRRTGILIGVEYFGEITRRQPVYGTLSRSKSIGSLSRATYTGTILGQGPIGTITRAYGFAVSMMRVQQQIGAILAESESIGMVRSKND